MRQLKIAKQVTTRDEASLEKYLREISRLDLVGTEEESALTRKIKEGDPNAFEKLINSNLRFVISVAKQYQNQGLSLSDLINEGNLGLIKAAGRFDDSRGFKFISYAVWWIRQSIMQAIAEQSRIIRLPLNKVGTLSKINKAFKKLEQEYQREPAPEEIADLLKLQIAVVKEALESSNYTLSTDYPLIENEGNDITLYDLLINNDSTSPDLSLINNSLQIEVERTLSTLSDREAEILRLFFGLEGKTARSFTEIASILEITTERVRQLKEKALKRLKDNNKNRLLRPYLG